jgi:hypothetical protein
MNDQILEQEKNYTIYKSSEWGPAVPYIAMTHEDGAKNSGFIDLTANPDLIESVPEAFGKSGLIELLKTVNKPQGPLMSLGCANGVFPNEASGEQPKLYVGSYLHLCFRNAELNTGERLLSLARTVAIARSSVVWAGYELGLERVPKFFGQTGLWCLDLRVSVYANDESRAWEGFNHEMRELAAMFEPMV